MKFSHLLIPILLSEIFFIILTVLLDLKSSWIVFLTIFYAAVIYILKYNKLDIFEEWRKKLFYAWIFIYPILNSIILYFAEHENFEYYRYLNTIEHFLLMGVLTCVCYGVFKNIFQNTSYFENLIILFSFVITIGAGIEILQFLVRTFLIESQPLYKIAAYYADSSADNITNVFSAVFWCLVWVESRE